MLGGQVKDIAQENIDAMGLVTKQLSLIRDNGSEPELAEQLPDCDAAQLSTHNAVVATQ